jgi:hypothetical protein
VRGRTEVPDVDYPATLLRTDEGVGSLVHFTTADDHRNVTHRPTDERRLRSERGSAFAHDPLAILVPGEVVVIVDAECRPGAKYSEHLLDHIVAPGIRIPTGELHRSDVKIHQERRRACQHHRRLRLGNAVGEVTTRSSRHETRSDRVTEATRTEVVRDPKIVFSIDKQIDVVVPRTNRAELSGSPLPEFPTEMSAKLLPGGAIIHDRIIDRN